MNPGDKPDGHNQYYGGEGVEPANNNWLHSPIYHQEKTPLAVKKGYRK